MQQSAVEWLYQMLWKQNDFSLPNNIFEQAKEIENDYKLKNQLFKGKVMDIIGWDKTLELLKECENAFKQ
jgi:hypothetical protein